MAFFAPLVAPLIGGLATGLVGGLFGKKDKAHDAAPVPAAQKAAPTMAGAQDNAAQEVAKRRRISMLSGGNTDVTRGTGALAPGQVQQKTLLGA